MVMVLGLEYWLGFGTYGVSRGTPSRFKTRHRQRHRHRHGHTDRDTDTDIDTETDTQTHRDGRQRQRQYGQIETIPYGQDTYAWP